ncbi:hypothetical protein [Candidatus Tokpelaia sp.]|uniref:hypothetical protein n=1 Tax=Candidatus Tokpelaia sp. TaxID=2233777 RepID=UPI0012387024|nr:hypothetical protein [Candidatus Tokpelaia sp.]KAA6404605.1 hypothetical protein DPQ22_08985 [Candidatus Tokpelaia sp.]
MTEAVYTGTETAAETSGVLAQPGGLAGGTPREKWAGPAGLPDRPTSGSDNLTAAEKAYFAARGEAELPEEAGEARQSRRPADGSGEAEAPGRVEPQQNKTVPHAALHAEREEHKKTRAELQKMRAKALEWQQELAALPQIRLPQAQQELPALPPDPREDFLGFARWQGQEINRLNEEIAAGKQQAEEKQRAAAAETAIMQEWDKAVQDARRSTPDIDAALEFLQEARMSQLGVLAPIDPRFADKAFCEKQIYAELRDIVIGTFQQGRNPAAAVYDIARAYGYGRDEIARMDRLKQAAAGARSLTAGPGKQVGDPFLLETVANMPEAEFAKWYERNKDSFRSMFGG